MQDSRPKVLINLTGHAENRPAGVARFCFALATHLARSGRYRYMLRTNYKQPALPIELVASGIEIQHVWTVKSRGRDVGIQHFTMDRFCRRHGIDLIVNSDPLGATSKRLPVATVLHDLYFKTIPDLYDSGNRFRMDTMFRHVLGRSDRIVCVSNTTRFDLEDHYPALAGRAQTIYSDAIFSAPLGSPAPSSGFDFPFILTVGNATPNKNLGVLGAAIIALRSRWANLRLVHVGDDPNEELSKLFKAQGCPDALVRERGVTEERLTALYRSAVCYCAPSVYEGFCLPLVEAQKQGCPTVYSNVSATAEVGGEGGLSFDPFNAEQLAGQIQKLLQDPATRKRLVEQGFANARRFSWDAAAIAYEEVFSDLLQTAGPALRAGGST